MYEILRRVPTEERNVRVGKIEARNGPDKLPTRSQQASDSSGI
jgi:hypothetical protein